MNSRRPYIKKYNSNSYMIIFGDHNNFFIQQVLAYCKASRLNYERCDTPNGRVRYKITQPNFGIMFPSAIKDLKTYIKDEYDEFHFYNKEMTKYVKEIANTI